VLFEVEVRLFGSYISPKCKYDHLEIERTVYLPQYFDERRDEDMRIFFRETGGE
jgi:hypothetical protein